MTSRSSRRGVVALGALVLTAAVGAAWAEIPNSQQQCLAAFGRGVQTVAKAQGKVVQKCVKDFAAGRLLATTPEGCLVTDASGRLAKASASAAASTAAKCADPPPFGLTPTSAALASAAIAEIDLVHEGVGANLNTALVPSTEVAACQSRVAAELLKCSDFRKREYVKCLKRGLSGGSITDATTLASTCLGSGASSQPDPTGKIARKCDVALAAAIASRCAGVDIAAAFPACQVASAPGLTACLSARSACRLCALANDANGLARDCDLFDDGDGSNGSCGAECGDGVLHPQEACDDGNAAAGDGCSPGCTVETGWTCSGSPSVCAPSCGNGTVDGGETCDDGNTADGDGCSSGCIAESGYTCVGSPSTCTRDCGNGVVAAGEACDDGNAADGDGCSSACQIEPGYGCTGQPSACTFVCGNGTFQAGEACDDGNAVPGDGCSGICQIETGWLCSGAPSHCAPVCGDGRTLGGETCDDGNVSSGDGCSLACTVEVGFACAGQPSNCLPVCGDGFIRGSETCDDGNVFSNDGCTGILCRKEPGWSCAGQPSVCIYDCGNGQLDPTEECDDGNHVNGDGCNAACRSEAGYVCSGQPSICILSCGNGALDAGETCDDGNAVGADGCSRSCRNESGYLCPAPGLPCTRYEVFIDSPAHGAFTTASSVSIAGHYTQLPAGQAAVLVNGVPAGSVNQVTRTFTATVPLDAAAIFNPINVDLLNTANGDKVHDRIVVHRGQSVANGAFSPQSVAMRINDSGLDAIEPLVGALAGSQLNLGTLLPVGTVITEGCFVDVIGCWGSATVKVGSPAPSYGSLSFAADSKTNAVGAVIGVHNLRIDVDIEGSGLVPNCGLRLTASTMTLSGDYAMQPDAADPSNVDVNLVTPMGVSFGGFNRTFTYGLCDAPIIGDIIQALLPDVEQLAVDGIRNFLSDPDGGGPQDSPIADGIEATLAGISITGPVGQGLGLMFEAPLFDVAEDPVGITFGSNSRFTKSVGTGPGQCLPPPGAPVLAASYSKPEAFPSFTANAPVSNQPYGLGIAISSAGFNQLLRGQTECGLMRASLTTIDLDGPGGVPPLPITSSLLSVLVPEFAQLPANTPLRIDIVPTLAPLVTGNAGPAGELTELKVAHVGVDIVEPGPETLWLAGAFDARLGMNLAFLPDGTGLSVTLSQPALDDLTMAVLYNPLGTDEAHLQSVLPGVMRPLIPDLASALSGFPLPQFFGLSLHGVEVSRAGQFMSLFANLTAAP